MKKITKIILGIAAVLVAVVGIYVAQYLIRYTFYDGYKKYEQDYSAYETGTEFAGKKDSDAAESFLLAAENDGFKLFIDPETCNVGLFDKNTKKTYYTNPYPLGTKGEESVNTDALYEQMQSQLILTYYMAEKPMLKTTYTTYSQCVGLELNPGEDKHYTIESIENGVRVIYTIGDTSTETGMVPKYLSPERYEEIVTAQDETGVGRKNRIKGKYQESKEYEGFLELGEANINPNTLGKLEEGLTQVGYTMDDYYADMEAAGAEVPEPLSFIIPLEYRLTKDGMETNIPTEQIKESGGGAIYEIAALPYFGAERKDGSDGYFLVPNGSGSLIRFNNGRMNSNVFYREDVYGTDLINVEHTIEDMTEDIKLPVFGIQKEDFTMLVTLDDGASFAEIQAFVSDVFSGYNCIYAQYSMRNLEQVKVDGQVDPMPVLEENLYAAYLKQSYHILPDTEEYDGYSGMAKYYRQILFGNDESAADSVISNQAENIKLYLDIIGAVKRESSFAGIKYDEVYAMTTFEQAEEILNSLSADGIDHVVMNYQGWMNGGYYHDTPDDISVIRKLGGKKGFAALQKALEEKGGLLYGDMAIEKVSYADESYNTNAQSSRYYGQGFVVGFGKIGPTTYSRHGSLNYRENLYDLLSPKFLPKYVEAMLSETKNLGISGISYRDLGSILYSDKKKKEFITREDAEHILLGMFEQIAADGKQVMLNNAIGITAPYADDMINVSFFKNAYVYVDEEVPFYEMVLHGYVDYCGKAYNLNANVTTAEECMDMIINGAYPHFTFTYEDSSKMKYTALNDHFSTKFTTWKDDAVQMYQNVNQVLSLVAHSTMEKHEFLENGAKTTYSNGVVITVDKNAGVVTVDNAGTTKTYEFK